MLFGKILLMSTHASWQDAPEYPDAPNGIMLLGKMLLMSSHASWQDAPEG